MRYEYQTTELLAEGRASFTVRSCEDYQSKAGNEMLKVGLAVTDSRNNKGMIYTYVYKQLGWFLASMGLDAMYNKSGYLDPSKVIGGSGECKIKTESSPGYEDKSAIEEFLPNQRDPNDQQQRNQDPLADDDLPF